ncbi:MAG: hypothetical protein JWN50_180 [Parcubacteria group bacterium]|nr:hypothetical protein [Parcubacteria group bacterium]
MDTNNKPTPVTLSKEDMQEVARERVSEIASEFTKGFEFLEHVTPSVTFFGSTQFKEDHPYYISARALGGKIVTDLKYSVLTGGGPGIMEAANRGAFETGGKSYGLTIKLPHPQIVNRYISDEISFYYFFVRKVCLSFSSEAFIFFPGGFGTLDEFFEMVTLVQTKKVAGIPIICVGADYWHALENYIGNELLSRGTITADDAKLFTITDNLDEVIEIVRKVPPRFHASFHTPSEIKKLESES